MPEHFVTDCSEDLAAHAGVFAAAAGWRRHAAEPVAKIHDASALSAQQLKDVTSIIDCVGPGGLTPLIITCLQGRTADAEALLALGADPTVECDVPAKNQFETTLRKYKLHPLAAATREGHIDIIRLLMAHSGTDVNQQSTTGIGWTALLMVSMAEGKDITKLLLACDEIDVNKASREDGITPLLEACYMERPEIIKLLLARDDVDVNTHAANGTTAFYSACDDGYTDIVQLLLTDGRACINEMCTVTFDAESSVNGIASTTTMTALHTAIGRGNIDTVKLLLARAEIDVNKAPPSDGITPLLMACHMELPEIIKLLLARDDVDVNTHAANGATVLYSACEDGHTDIVQLVLADGRACINEMCTVTFDAESSVNGIASTTTMTALHMAVSRGNIDTVKLLLARAEIDVNKPTREDGITPLLKACYNEYPEIVKLLLARDDVDVNTHAANGATVLYSACEDGHTDIVQLVLADGRACINEMCTVTFDAESSVNGIASTTTMTALHMAVSRGNIDTVKLLLARAEIDVNKALPADGITPLLKACYNEYPEIVKLLLARDDVDVNTHAANGTTVLYSACEVGHTDIVQLVLADGRANLDEPCAVTTDAESSGDGFASTTTQTALHEATNNGHFKIVQLLIAYGASRSVIDECGDTPAQLANTNGPSPLSKWYDATAGWSQLRVAAGCRLYKGAASALKHGRMDPDDPTTAFREDIAAAIATSKTEPAALPWENASPICKNTQKFVRDATRGWHRTTHWLYHKQARKAVFAVLVVALRLDRKDSFAVQALVAASDDANAVDDAAIAAAAAASADEDTAEKATTLPLLPIELWLFMMSFLMRSWWVVKE